MSLIFSPLNSRREYYRDIFINVSSHFFSSPSDFRDGRSFVTGSSDHVVNMFTFTPTTSNDGKKVISSEKNCLVLHLMPYLT